MNSPISWPDLPAAQQPTWPDAAALDSAVAELRSLPPLVFAGECDLLADRMAAASQGRAFVLTGGDCAETFDGATADQIRGKLKTVLQMAVVLTYGASLPVVKVGRMAGQYGKPRSADGETRDGVTLPSYRGDAVNALPFDEAGRVPDPQRMVKAYHTASATLNLVRAFTQGRLRRPARGARLEPGLREGLRRGPEVRADGGRDRPRAALHARGRRRPRGVQAGRVLRRPRGSAARLREGADPRRLAHRQALRRLGPLRVDRGAHPSARRRARRLRRAHLQPDRREARPEHQPRAGGRAVRPARPRPRAPAGSRW